MKRNHLMTRTLALALAATVCMTGNTGVQTFAQSLGAMQQEMEEHDVTNSEQTAIDVGNVQDVKDEPTSQQNENVEAEDSDTEQMDSDMQETPVNPFTNNDNLDSVSQNETELGTLEKEEPEERMDDDIVSDGVETPLPGTTLVKNVVQDQTLCAAILQLYNKYKLTSYTINNFKVEELMAYDGTLNFSESTVDVSAVTNLTGLGYARKATSINVSKTKATEIKANEFCDCQFTSITLPVTVTSIGDSSFTQCDNLKSIKLSDNVTKIGSHAFEGCDNLKSINSTVANNTLPSKLSLVGTNTFTDCKALEQIIIPDFQNGETLQNATAIFANCKALQSVTIGAGLNIIPNSAFAGSGCETGMTVTIKNGSKLKKIVMGAFKGANLSSIDLSMCNYLMAIEDSAFELSSDTKPNPDNEYEMIPSQDVVLKSIKMPLSILDSKGNPTYMSIGKNAFKQTNLESMYTDSAEEGTIVIPNYVNKLGAGAFYNDESIKKVKLSYKMDAINKSTFENCKNLKTVITDTYKINNQDTCDIKIIDDCAFRKTALTDGSFVEKMNKLEVIGSTQLENQYIEDTNSEYLYNVVQEPSYENNDLIAGSEVFVGTGLTKITFPASLISIGSRAFLNIATLNTVEWKSPLATQTPTTRTIGTEAFMRCGLLSFTFPESNAKQEGFIIGASSFRDCKYLATIESGTNTENGLFPISLSFIDMAAFMRCNNIQKIKIKERIDKQEPKFEEACFANCNSLSTVVLPGTTKTIAKAMFYDSGVSSFKLEGSYNNLTTIGDKAFFGSRFTVLDLSSYTKLNRLGSFAFSYYDNDRSPIYPSRFLENPSLTTVILPNEVEGDKMTLGYNLFHNAQNFNTLAIGMLTDEQKNKINIPDYISNDDCENGVFAVTSVSEVSWQFEQTGKNPWTYIPGTMFFATKVNDISKCLFKNPNQLKSISDYAFMGCKNISVIDLTPYTQMSEMGVGVFSECFNLEKITLSQQMTRLPDSTFRIGDFDPSLVCRNQKGKLKEVNLGGVKELGDYCFSTVNSIQIEDGFAAETVWSTALANIDLTNVEKIGTGAFYGCTDLKNIIMGNELTEIGNYAFASCSSLVLTNSPISDSVKTIGEYAFYRCESLGKVVFGSQLETIGRCAFYDCVGKHVYNTTNKYQPPVNITYTYTSNGLRDVDFNNAVKLNTIGDTAFSRTGIKSFEVTNSMVKLLQANTLYECPNLENVKLGNSFEYIDDNSIAACPKLTRVNIYATTTISQYVFHNPSGWETNYGYTSSNLTISVSTDEVTTVGIGRKMAFPYYVSEYTQTDMKPAFSSFVIGNSYSDSSVEEYVNVSGRVATNYYKKANLNDAEHYVSAQYFNRMSDPQLYTTPFGKQVETFFIEGNKGTPEGETIEFHINTQIEFFKADNTSFKKDFDTVYHLKVQQMEYKTVLYTDYERNNALNLTPDRKVIDSFSYNIQAQANEESTKTFFYKIKDTCASYSQPDSPNIVIETDNAAVAYPSNGYNEPGTSCQITQNPDFTYPSIDDATNGLAFNLIPIGVGVANIKIYPEGHPQYAVNMTVTVNSDIYTIALSAPEEYASGVMPGDKFNIFESYQTYLNQKVERPDLSYYAIYSNNIITYTSDKPEIASVDNNGNVTINNVPKMPEEVTFTATAKGSGDYDAVSSLTYTVTYPPAEVGKNTKDIITGAVVAPIEISDVDNKGTAAYVAPPDKTASTVTIPATVMISGVKYKVTEIADNAFKNNKYIKKVTIGKYVKTIGANAFYGCKNLSTVNFASGSQLQKIGKNAFYNCLALKKITIPAKVTEIGVRAFKNCKKLSSVKFASKSRLSTIGNSAFEGCISLKTITIPTKVKTLGSKVFYGDKKLKSIIFKTTVLNSVGKNTFKSIYKKATIKVPKKKLDEYRSLLSKKGQSGSTKIKS